MTNPLLVSSEPETKKVMLIVDDSEYIRERLVDYFSKVDKIGSVYQARNSDEAYSSMLLYLPDIILLDIHIPGDNGIRVLEKIKDSHPEIIIIMLTNYPYEVYRKRCMELGADLFFSKSADLAEIYSLCENLGCN